jgi:hypothetical protein
MHPKKPEPQFMQNISHFFQHIIITIAAQISPENTQINLDYEY